MSKEWESGIGERAANLQSRHLALRRAYDARDGSKRADELWRDAAAAFHAALQSFYAPYDQILVGVRRGRAQDIEEATRFLVADPWCFRSGYLKEELMHALANTHLPSHVVPALREVVVHRIREPQPRLLRYAAQLAANLWDGAFEEQITELERAASDNVRRNASYVKAGAKQRLRSIETDDRLKQRGAVDTRVTEVGAAPQITD